jgi:hypothetical protein
MIKNKFNLFGGGFIDFVGDINKRTKFVEWVPNKIYSDISFYVDEGLKNIVSKSTINYGWLRESKTIIPNTYIWAEENIDILKNKFKKVFTHDVNLSKKSDVFQLTQCDIKPHITDGDIYPKTKLISMVASSKIMCSEHLYRQKIIQKYKNKLDHFGRGFNEIENKIDALKDYCFSIVVENATYPNMITEKITDCFITGTIPIYYGISNIGDFFNSDGIILLDEDFKIEDLTFELYYSKMSAIKDNYQISIDFPLAEDYIFKNFIDLK